MPTIEEIIKNQFKVNKDPAAIREQAEFLLQNWKGLGQNAPAEWAQAALRDLAIYEDITSGTNQLSRQTDPAFAQKKLESAFRWITGDAQGAKKKRVLSKAQDTQQAIEKKIRNDAANIANILDIPDDIDPARRAKLEEKAAAMQAELDKLIARGQSLGIPQAQIDRAQQLVRTEGGFIPGQEASISQGRTSDVGEATRIEQNDDGTFSVIGVQSGNVLASGLANTQEALARQQQLVGGGTPGISGAPDVFAIAPTTAEEQGAIERGEARVATPEELAAGEAEFTSTAPTQIRNVEELQRLAALGLTESDITRQGSAIFLNQGINEDFLRQRGVSPAGGGSVPGGATGAFDTGVEGAAAMGQTLAQQRTGVLDQFTGGGAPGALGTTAAEEGQLLQTIGTGIMEQEKALRELPATIQERTQNIGVTQGQLNRLIATEREPIAQALKDLLMSRSLLQEQIAFRREETMFQQQQMDKQFEKMLAGGIGDEAAFSQMDAVQGLPAGTHAGMFNAQMASNAAEAQKASLEMTGKIVDILGNVPLGQEINIGGQIYTGLSTEGIKSGTEEDSFGNLTYWQVDPRTGQITTQNLGQIGKAAGWETIKSDDGSVFQLGPNGEKRWVYDPNNAGGGFLSGGVFDAYAEGDYGGQCGAWVNKITGRALGLGDSFEQKMSKMDPSITAENVQAGDVFVQHAGVWTGHTGIVTGKHVGDDGRVYLDVMESNWNSDEKIGKRYSVPADKFSGFARPGLLPEYKFGTDTAPKLDQKTLETVAKTPEAERLRGLVGYKSALQNYQSLIQQYGSAGALQPSQRQQLDRARTDVLLAIKDAEQLGALQAPDIAIIESKLPDVTAEGFFGTFGNIFTGQARANRAINTLQADLDSIVGKSQNEFDLLRSRYPGIENTDFGQTLQSSLGFNIPTTAPSGYIQVSNRETGQIGIVPINEYDPDLYIKI